MYYRISVAPLPKLTEIYCISRNTTWRCADKNNLLVFIKEGQCYFSLNSEEYLLKKGQAIFIPSNTPYVRRSFEGSLCTLYYVHFLTDIAPIRVTKEQIHTFATDTINQYALNPASNQNQSEISEHIYLSDIFEFSDEYDRIFSLLDGISRDEFKAANPYSRLNASLSLTKLLSKFSHSLIRSVDTYEFQKDGTLPLPLQKALLYVQKNYRKKLSTQKLAMVSEVTQQHIIRLFKTHLGETPIEYINRVKILHAIDMLRHTEMSIKEISYELGFENPNYFSRLFKKEQNESPKDARIRIHNFSKNHSSDKV